VCTCSETYFKEKDMHKRTFVGLCAALAFVAGSPGAHALKIADTAPTDRAGVEAADGSITYASETLLTTRVTEVSGDSTKYYNVGADAETLVLSLPGDVPASAGDTYLVSVALDGMVFRTALTNESLAAAASGAADATFEIASGGAAKDKTVVFRKTPTGIINGTSILNLSASLAVSSEGGSATVTLTNQTVAGLNIPNVSGTKTHGPANVIKVASALKETPMASNLTASVTSSFKKFKGAMADDDDVTVGHVGSITIGVNGHRIAATGDASFAGGASAVVDGLEDIAVTGQEGTGDTATAISSVSFMGDFSFAEKVFVHGDDDCGVEIDDTGASGGTDRTLAFDAMNIQMEGTGDDAMVTDTTKPVNVDGTPGDATDQLASFMTYLCIMVQGDDTDDMDAPRIPDTDAYTAMGSYKALDDAASGPMGMARMLGEINRDGTKVHLPYLTKHTKFHQRLRMVNRSSVDVRYEMDFHGDGDVAGMDAEGMLGADSVTVLSLSDDEVVTLPNGRQQTSATLIVEANPDMIDVATVQVTRATGASDTVVYSP
jgi:hypothetical protein